MLSVLDKCMKSNWSVGCITFLLCISSVQCQGRLGYFRGDSYAILPTTLSLQSHMSLSFRTCEPGTLLYQRGDSGDTLNVTVFSDGQLQLHVRTSGRDFYSSFGEDLVDNQWHSFSLRQQLGVLMAKLDGNSVVVANMSSNGDVLQSDFGQRDPELEVGKFMVGCILEGAGVVMSEVNIKGVNVQWNLCPLADQPNCEGYGTDPCYSQPCYNHGKCVSQGSNYHCQCTAKYTGILCETIQSPLCVRPEYNICSSTGECMEDSTGNSTYCECQQGYIGKRCRIPISSSNPNDCPCENNGVCQWNKQIPPTFRCICPRGFTGASCSINIDDCLDEPCKHGGVCIDGVNSYTCNCTGSGYKGVHCEEDINECTDFEPCANGGTCFNQFGHFECQCKPGYGGDYCEIELDECSSSPCKNGGSCNDGPDMYLCYCPQGFSGKQCERNIDDCINISCPPDSYCVDGINSHSCMCKEGYTGIPGNCVEIDECSSNPCQNEGTCHDFINFYTCECPPGFTGRECELGINECAMGMCQHDAKCVDLVNNYLCECPAGYTGRHCEEDIDECASEPCQNAINCTNTDGGYRCMCKPGWVGLNCDEDVDDCLTQPCIIGTCIDKENGYLCECPLGYGGIHCENNIDDCESNPCLNNGSCVDGINDFMCTCTPQYMGKDCSEVFDACASGPCLNGGSCITTQPNTTFYCECPRGFEGLHCQNNIDDCFNQICENGKICFDLVDGYDCRCPEGHEGENCEINIDECRSSPCLNNGSCVDGINNFTCICPSNYTGKLCQEDVDECDVKQPCMNGICQNYPGGYQCYCRPGFSGDHCNLDFDECLSHPCQNNGTCKNLINGYRCDCTPGFTGIDCDSNIDECASNPCLNGATCVDEIAMFQCLCLSGFTGISCQININECESSPCQNGGICEDGINEYVCNCEDTGFVGTHCEININECESSPCIHGSTCIDLIKDYQCGCFSGFEGKNCEIDIDECAASPCQNGGSCTQKSELLTREERMNYAIIGGYVCECVPGFTGIDCEININECESSPCLHGQCNDLINGYQCACFPGYEGQFCEVEIDECSRYTPCIYGECVDGIGDYTCLCSPDFGGKNCSVRLKGCVHVTCQNSGTCVPYLLDETEHKFNCSCPHGFSGSLCELVTTMSFLRDSYVECPPSRRAVGHDLSLRFRTTLPDVLLAVGRGDTYYKLQLTDGRLNLDSSLLNKKGGIYVGKGLNNGEWQTGSIKLNYTHTSLSAIDSNGKREGYTHPTSPAEHIKISATSFGEVVLGVKPGFSDAVSDLNYLGCMQDVFVDGEAVLPHAVPNKREIVEECVREEQCKPNPCANGGSCNDLWNSHTCLCKRPYLPPYCKLSYAPVTFGHEDRSDSIVKVDLPLGVSQRLQTYLDISLFIRTRNEDGIIFYIGDSNVQGSSNYIIAQLVNSYLNVVALMDQYNGFWEVNSAALNDGYSHLIQVLRNESDFKILINGTIQKQDVLPDVYLNAEVMYLGNLPQAHRSIRQIGGRPPFFKGVIKDIQLGTGDETYAIEPYPISDRSPAGTTLLPALPVTESEGTLEGEVTDDVCARVECENGGTCMNTFNDYRCICTPGFKGKTCDKQLYCYSNECPEDSRCNELEDGFECIANATFVGQNSSITYKLRPASPWSGSNSIEMKFRVQGDGTLLEWDTGSEKVLNVRVEGVGVVARWMVNGIPDSVRFGNISSDSWHYIKIVFNSTYVTTYFDGDKFTHIVDIPLELSDYLDYVTIRVWDHVDPHAWNNGAADLSFTGDVNSNALAAEQHVYDGGPNSTYFRGCMTDARVGGFLLPFVNYTQEEGALLPFYMNTAFNVDTGCTLCREEECRNDGECEDPEDSFICECPVGFTGQFCEVNIDECVENECVNGTCIDGINSYTCDCNIGFTGQRCETDIDECESSPCMNGGRCIDQVADYQCACTEDYIGRNCEERRVVTCQHHPCYNGANCTDIYDGQRPVSYACDCAFGYEGMNCSKEIRFCDKDPCLNQGECFEVDYSPGYVCDCQSGFTGPTCSINIDDCANTVCENGGSCIDGIDSFTCSCISGWKGKYCEEDIDECFVHPCGMTGTCENFPGTYECICPPGVCGRHCNLADPCYDEFYNLKELCSNNGRCESFCEEVIRMECVCNEPYRGLHCNETEELGDALTGSDIALIVGPILAIMVLIGLVGLAAFVIMARKKRATRGTYSPSRQEMYGSRVEMGNIMKPPPEERLI